MIYYKIFTKINEEKNKKLLNWSHFQEKANTW